MANAARQGQAKAKAKAGKDEVQFGVHSEVGQLRKVMVCAPGPRARAPDAVQLRRSCCSTTCCGSRTPSATTSTS